MSNMKKCVYEMPHKLPNDIQLSFYGSKKIFEIFENLVRTHSIVQPPFQK